MERTAKILIGIDRGMRVLELGPSFSPIASKADGWDVCTVDHASREELIEKYREEPNVDVSRIEDVDVIWAGGLLGDAMPSEWHGTFDACVASHLLEHIPDPIGLLQSLERIVKPSGVVSLVIPDKRFCFDYFKSLSTTGELLVAHSRGVTRHTHKTLFDHVAYLATSAGEVCWGRRPVGDLAFFHSLADAKNQLEAYGIDDDGPYVDCHAWHFTPSSFELSILELAALEAIDFSVDRSFPTELCEFYVTLRRGRDVPEAERELDARRLELLRQTCVEVREQMELLIDGRNPRVLPAPVPATAQLTAWVSSAQGRVGAIRSRLGRARNRLISR